MRHGTYYQKEQSCVKLLVSCKSFNAWLLTLCPNEVDKDDTENVILKALKARSSVGERFLDAEEVRGSIPLAPTILIKDLPVSHLILSFDITRKYVIHIIM
jgi:hypothetical protein